MPDSALYPLFENVHRAVSAGDSVLIVSPSPPDVDSVSSCKVLKDYAEQLGKTVILFCADEVSPAQNSLLRFLPEMNFLRELPDPFPPCVLTADYGSYITTGLLTGIWFPEQSELFGFDHHATPAKDFPMHGRQIVDAKASSATEILYEFLKYLHIPITKEMATAILLGIFTDTGRLAKPGRASAETIRIMAECIELGAPFEEIQMAAEPVTSLERLQAWGKIIGYIEVSERLEAAFLSADLDLMLHWGAKPKDVLSLFGQHVTKLDNIKIAVLLLQESMYEWKIVFRSKDPRNRPVDQIAERIGKTLGGGGHADEAVARVSTEQDGYISKILARIHEEIAYQKSQI